MAKETLLLSLMTMAYCKDNATIIEYNVFERNMWLNGFNDCKHIPNFTMASADDIEDRKKIDIEFTSELGKYLPVWTYAFEVTEKSSGNSFRIKSNDILNHANIYMCSDDGGQSVSKCCAPLIDAQGICKREFSFNLSLPELHPQTLKYFAQRIFINASRWGIIQDESEFLHESADWSVRCLLLDENGKLRTDNCTEHHRTLCIRDTTQTVIQYVNELKIPRYTTLTTERQTSGWFSNTEYTTITVSIGTNTKSTTEPQTLDWFSNTDFTTVTVSIGTNTVPTKPDVAGTGVSIGVVIIVCISSVVLIILVVVLTILIMKKRSMIQETHHRVVEYVAEQTNGITPINNEAGHAYESVDERHNEEHSSGSPNTQGSAYESLGERHNEEHSYGIPNTQRSAYESLGEKHSEKHGGYGTPALATSGFYQPLEEENVDTHTSTKIAHSSRKLEYDSLGDKTKETRPNQTINVEAYEWVE